MLGMHHVNGGRGAANSVAGMQIRIAESRRKKIAKKAHKITINPDEVKGRDRQSTDTVGTLVE